MHAVGEKKKKRDSEVYRDLTTLVTGHSSSRSCVSQGGRPELPILLNTLLPDIIFRVTTFKPFFFFFFTSTINLLAFSALVYIYIFFNCLHRIISVVVTGF